MTFFSTAAKLKLSLVRLGVVWTNDEKKVFVQIKNVGIEKSGPLVINFDVEGEVATENPQAKIYYTLKELKTEEFADFKADFTPLAQFDNQYLMKVNRLMIYIEEQTDNHIGS